MSFDSGIKNEAIDLHAAARCFLQVRFYQLKLNSMLILIRICTE